MGTFIDMKFKIHSGLHERKFRRGGILGEIVSGKCSCKPHNTHQVDVTTPPGESVTQPFMNSVRRHYNVLPDVLQKGQAPHENVVPGCDVDHVIGGV